MTDDRETTSGGDRAPSESDGEVEIEVTQGRFDRSREFDHPDRSPPESRVTDSVDGQSQASSSDDRAYDAGATDAESELADELGRIDVMTTPEGYVEGRITDITTIDSTTVRLTVALPHGETPTFTLDKPIPWSREFFLARLVEEIGYDAASIDHIVGEPVYLARTDLDEDDEWWARSVQTAGDTLVSSLSGGRYRLESTTEPEWRLVDPLELPAESDSDGIGDLLRSDRVGAALVLFGVLIATIGSVVGATGGFALTGPVVAPALVGLLVAWFGVTVLLQRDDTVSAPNG